MAADSHSESVRLSRKRNDVTPMERALILSGALFMFLGVAAGAFGAHGLAGYFERYPEFESTFETAVRYQLIHGLGLFIAAWLSGKMGGVLPTWAGIAFLAGILLFSGSLYLLVFSRQSWLGAVTPLGGIAFLTGWLCIALTAWRS